MDKKDLIEMNFKSLSVSDKRVAFMLMDLMLKRLHKKNIMVTDFEPSNIYFENGYYYFEKTATITKYNADSKEDAILKNEISLANLAFCSYLLDYNLAQGLLNQSVICNNFSNFEGNFPKEDRDYYKMILVDSFEAKKLVGDSPYYYDYILKHQDRKNMDSSNRNLMVKANEAGRAMANQENEAAFSNLFFLVTMVASLTILLVSSLFFFFH